MGLRRTVRHPAQGLPLLAQDARHRQHRRGEAIAKGGGEEVEAQLQEAIAKLPDTQRTVFLMRYYDEMRYSDISQILGTTEGGLKASYHIAVKKITDFFHRND